jgi:hypothetical protein
MGKDDHSECCGVSIPDAHASQCREATEGPLSNWTLVSYSGVHSFSGFEAMKVALRLLSSAKGGHVQGLGGHRT